MKTIYDRIYETGIIPVIKIEDAANAVPLAKALIDGGLPAAEITFRTDCAADAIRHAAEQFPGVCVGAGTVINAGQAELALSCGAKFIVSPGFSDEVAAVCGQHSVPYLPGCVTPTEIMHAIDCGITTVKFFPADVYGGLSAIRALAAPFPQVRFLPTGGIGFDNLRSYLSCDRIAAVGGSFLCRGDIRANCRRLDGILAEEV